MKLVLHESDYMTPAHQKSIIGFVQRKNLPIIMASAALCVSASECTSSTEEGVEQSRHVLSLYAASTR